MEEFDGHREVERRHGDGYSRLLSPHQRAVGGVLADLLALTGSATMDGDGHRAGQCGLRPAAVNCTDVFTTGVDASGAISCAALTATGTVAGATLSSTGAVSGSSLSISGAALSL